MTFQISKKKSFFLRKSHHTAVLNFSCSLAIPMIKVSARHRKCSVNNLKQTTQQQYHNNNAIGELPILSFPNKITVAYCNDCSLELFTSCIVAASIWFLDVYCNTDTLALCKISLCVLWLWLYTVTQVHLYCCMWKISWCVLKHCNTGALALSRPGVKDRVQPAEGQFM